MIRLAFPRSHRRRHSLFPALVICAALFAVAVTAEAVEHLALLAIALGPSAAAFWAGRRWERHKAAAGKIGTAMPISAGPHPADQAALTAERDQLERVVLKQRSQLDELEHLTGKSVDELLATYRRIGKKYGGKP